MFFQTKKWLSTWSLLLNFFMRRVQYRRDMQRCKELHMKGCPPVTWAPFAGCPPPRHVASPHPPIDFHHPTHVGLPPVPPHQGVPHPPHPHLLFYPCLKEQIAHFLPGYWNLRYSISTTLKKGSGEVVFVRPLLYTDKKEKLNFPHI